MLYTDGVIESRSGRELFGDRTARRGARRAAPSAPQEIAEAVLAACRAYAGGDLPDDCAIVVIKRVNLAAGDGRPLVIGHRGAAAVAPENTLAALEAAVAAGVDLVEFDISPGLLLAHSELELPADSIDLDDALDICAGTSSACTST